MQTCRGALFALLTLCLTASAVAQVPTTAEPGRIEERFKPPLVPQAAPEIRIPGPEAPMPSAEAQKIHFVLRGVIINGATVFPQEKLERLFRGLLNKEVTLAQLFAVRDAITTRYRSAGYILSQAIIPPQKITDGTIHIRVIEGYIDHVYFMGNVRSARDLIEDTGNRIKESRPLKSSVLERYILLLSDIPGCTVRTVIKPSAETPGAATLIVTMDRDHFTGQMRVDNYGSRAIGPEEAQFGLTLNSVFGLDEQTSFLFATTGQPKQLQYGQLTSSWILNSDGLRFTGAASYSDSKPSGSIAPLNAIGHSLNIHGTLDGVIHRARSENLRTAIEFTYLNSGTSLLGAPFSKDRLRYITARATYDFSDTALGSERPASTVLSGEFKQGVPILGASKNSAPDLSRAGGRADFTLVYGEATRVQPLFKNVSAALSLSGQWAATGLLTPVQFGVGGSQFGRGYEPSELTGDHGVAGSFEVRYDIPFVSKLLGHPQLYGFYDLGQVWSRNAAAGQSSAESLASTGGGLRLTLLRHFEIDLGVGKPLTRPIASRGNKDVRPLFSFSTRF